ncbi:MAG: hypothetical protein GY777_06105 [Candidatus Brocadiaceae bacterium]|nr:hypothetical protein [Candidatus Brocadiaceae bacterium]
MRKIEKAFAELDYSVCLVKKTNENSFGGLLPIKNIEVHSDCNASDYLFIPKELRSKVLEHCTVHS